MTEEEYLAAIEVLVKEFRALIPMKNRCLEVQEQLKKLPVKV